MNTLEQIIAYVVAFGLLILAFRLAHKDKFKSCLVVAVLAFAACNRGSKGFSKRRSFRERFQHLRGTAKSWTNSKAQRPR